jgi:hypothetical protein
VGLYDPSSVVGVAVTGADVIGGVVGLGVGGGGCISPPPPMPSSSVPQILPMQRRSRSRSWHSGVTPRHSGVV